MIFPDSNEFGGGSELALAISIARRHFTLGNANLYQGGAMIQGANPAVPRKSRTICLPFCQDEYGQLVKDPKQFRRAVDETAQQHACLFPDGFQNGYEMKDIRYSKRLDIWTRRILMDDVSYTIRPSFVMPYMTGMVHDVEKPLFLRKFDVPYWALAYCYGRNAMYWYRLEAGLGRFSIVGTTIKDPNLLPCHVVADEKHTWLNGDKVYCATTVAGGCILGASVTNSAGQEDLENAYGVFKQEAQTIKPDYSPVTVNTDGWLPTRNAWKAHFPTITLLMCFLHVFISIRDRSSKKFKEIFAVVSEKLWNCYRAQTKMSFSQRVRRLCEWSRKAQIPAFMVDKLEKLHKNLASFAQAYDFHGAFRTSNMLDRLMQRMDRRLFAGQYFHGNLNSANLSMRAWALIHNFAPFNPRTIELNNGAKSSAERLNGFCYHSNWLQNLLISASLGGYKPGPPNPL
jgi:hypothetical protein